MIHYISKGISASLEEKISLYKKYKIKDEDIFLGNIPKEEIEFSSADEIFNDISTYFYNERYNTIITDKQQTFEIEFENFTKLCWLADEYLNDNKLSNPVGIHFNPRTYKNIIHPGRSRQKILKLFHTGDIHSVYFNTGAVKTYPWMIKMDRVGIDYFLNKNVYIDIVPDHGSFIPHIHFSQNSIPIKIHQYHNIIKSRLDNLSIETNYKCDFLNKWIKPNSTAELIIRQDADKFEISKAIIMLILKRQYESWAVKINYD